MPWTGVFFAEMFDAPLISFSPAGPVGPFMVGSGNDINLSVQPLIMGRFLHKKIDLEEQMRNF